MKTSILISLLFLFIFNESISGQVKVDTVNRTRFKHALGVGVGFTTGNGLSYRFTPNKFGVQASFVPYKDDYQTQFSFGVTFLYQLIETEKANLFLYQGNSFLYSKDYQVDYYYNGNKVEKYFNNGVGIGIEFIILKRVSFNLMAGYAGYENFDRIGFTGETGLYFKF